jgi:hypothetical protein
MTMDVTTYILRGLTREGEPVFNTGKAGQARIDPDRSKAFEYGNIDAARVRATTFNSRESLHGMWFVAMPTVVRSAS